MSFIHERWRGGKSQKMKVWSKCLLMAWDEQCIYLFFAARFLFMFQTLSASATADLPGRRPYPLAIQEAAIFWLNESSLIDNQLRSFRKRPQNFPCLIFLPWCNLCGSRRLSKAARYIHELTVPSAQALVPLCQRFLWHPLLLKANADWWPYLVITYNFDYTLLCI